jgi:hypothetical protein
MNIELAFQRTDPVMTQTLDALQRNNNQNLRGCSPWVLLSFIGVHISPIQGNTVLFFLGVVG